MSQMHEITTVIRRPESSQQQLTNGFQQQQPRSTETVSPANQQRHTPTTKNDRNNNKEKLINKNNVVKKSMPPPVPPKRYAKITPPNASQINKSCDGKAVELKQNQKSINDAHKIATTNGRGNSSATVVINRVCGQKNLPEKIATNKIDSNKLSNSLRNQAAADADKNDEDSNVDGTTSASVIKKGQNGASDTKNIVAGNGATECTMAAVVATTVDTSNTASGCSRRGVDDTNDKSDKLNDDDVASLPTNECKNRLNSGTSNNCHNGKTIFILTYLSPFSPQCFFVTRFVTRTYTFTSRLVIPCRSVI